MDIMKCFAFNTAGLRCMQPAGHEGSHAHAIEWSDDECWTPEMNVITPTVTLARSEITVQPEWLVPEPPKGSGRCFCGHSSDHDNPCGVRDGDDMPCDCMTPIEV